MSESKRIDAVLDNSSKENTWNDWLSINAHPTIFVLAEGFEERSIGLLRRFAKHGYKPKCCILFTYQDTYHLNARFREEFDTLLNIVCGQSQFRIPIDNAQNTMLEAIERYPNAKIVLDVSGFSTKTIFGMLDVISTHRSDFSIAYTEALEYRPTKEEWDKISTNDAGHECTPYQLAERENSAPFIHSGSYTLEFINGHDGYDTGSERALVAFLPFKPARLAAILSEYQYANYSYIVGVPSKEQNGWRVDALVEMNIMNTGIGQSDVLFNNYLYKCESFGYLNCLKYLKTLIIGDNGLAHRYDIHLAPFGSKLQNLACWIISKCIPSISVITANPDPSSWHPNEYSHSFGESWIFDVHTNWNDPASPPSDLLDT